MPKAGRRGLLFWLGLGCPNHHPLRDTSVSIAQAEMPSRSAKAAFPASLRKPRALAHSPIMMPENARMRAATRAEVTTERIRESGRRGSGVGDTGRQVPAGHR